MTEREPKGVMAGPKLVVNTEHYGVSVRREDGQPMEPVKAEALMRYLLERLAR